MSYIYWRHAGSTLTANPSDILAQLWAFTFYKLTTATYLSPVLTAPVSAVPALFATVRARTGPFRPVKTASSGTCRNSADGCGEDRALWIVLDAKKIVPLLQSAVALAELVINVCILCPLVVNQFR